ncbi:MAG: glycosyl transferase [Vampirovibrio sp.]|jgi:glycosyltransferase involved in cell wall biosynthesis|nr:glycosyl transferase [Vampirovibrio sp.]
MASNTLTVSCIIPAYNEGEAIREVVSEIQAVYPDFELIVVDDGSRDNTAEVAEQAGAKVIRHTYNIGNGAAVKTGIRNATGDVIVMLDADGQHPPNEIARLLQHIGPYDMAVGARTSMSKVSKFRSFGNWGLIRIAEFLTGAEIPDLTSGFRAIKRDKVMEFIHLFPNQYSYPTTITMCMLKSGYFVKFVPMDSIRRRELGTSNIKPFRDGMKFINIMVRIIMLFDPQKVFLPLGSFCFLLGILIALVQILTKLAVTGSAVMMVLSGLLIVLFGLVADQVAAVRREMSRLR